jgi:F0F1-type ATP synthase assembly protein I
LLQLVIKALVSGLLIAAASEVARRSPGWGGLIASLPLTSLLAMLWLWRDGGDATRIAEFATGATLYVIASLPAFAALALLLRRGVTIPVGMAVFVAIGFAGYLVMITAGRRWGWPV